MYQELNAKVHEIAIEVRADIESLLRKLESVAPVLCNDAVVLRNKAGQMLEVLRDAVGEPAVPAAAVSVEPAPVVAAQEEPAEVPAGEPSVEVAAADAAEHGEPVSAAE